MEILLELDSVDATLLLAFLIVGLLLFAKNAPQFIFDALGIKSKGSFMKMLNMGTTAISGVGDSIAAGKAAWKKAKDEDGKIKPLSAISAVSRGLFSGAGAISAGGNAILTTDKPTWTTGMDAAKKYQAQNMKNIRAGYGVGQKLLSGAKSAFGYDIDAEIQNAHDIENAAKKYKDYAMNEGAKYFSDEIMDGVTDSHGNSVRISKNDLQAMIAEASGNGRGYITINRRNYALNGSDINKISGEIDEAMGSEYIKEVNAGTLRKPNGDLVDGTVLQQYATIYANATGYSNDFVSTQDVGDLKTEEKTAATKAFKLETERGPKS